MESAAGKQQAFMQLPAAGKCGGSPPAVRGAVWATCNGVEAGQSCSAACNEPGTVGEFSSVCMPDGRWGPPSGSCSKYTLEMTCRGTPKAVEGATWPDCTGFKPGDQCVASGCDQGYIGMGYVSNCMLDGSWNDIWGDCRRPGTVINTESGGNHV
ncbi:hypothetical protein OEZ85_002632 [Tetradesmus obliquus]|uniref:Sushi domain-containing protein n=1 Tax=Tetradesmus obliquus TaxID=3088 RepID=A0ABY8TYJ7_TETOB|nr:hypothetical protein OEZ85_002632 [Tetradesmus obliquus]